MSSPSVSRTLFLHYPHDELQKPQNAAACAEEGTQCVPHEDNWEDAIYSTKRAQVMTQGKVTADGKYEGGAIVHINYIDDKGRTQKALAVPLNDGTSTSEKYFFRLYVAKNVSTHTGKPKGPDPYQVFFDPKKF